VNRTEDDTFNALRRTPFFRLFVMCLGSELTLGQDIIRENLSLIVANGWTEDEFRQKMLLELHNDNVSLDIMIVNDKEWQRNLLKKV